MRLKVAANRERFCDSSGNAAIKNQKGADDLRGLPFQLRPIIEPEHLFGARPPEGLAVDERAVHPASRQAQARRRNAKRAARLHRAVQRVGAAPQVRRGGVSEAKSWALSRGPNVIGR